MRKPRRQRRHVGAEDDEVRRIGDRQHEAGRVGDEGADQQIGQRLHARRRRRRIDRGRQHDGGGVVRQEDRDQRAHAVDDEEQALRRAARRADRQRRQPVEQSLLTRDFGQQHHAAEEQVDVGALAGGGERIAPRQQPHGHERRCAQHRPDEFRHAERTDDHAQRGCAGDAPDEAVAVHVVRDLRPSRGRARQRSAGRRRCRPAPVPAETCLASPPAPFHALVFMPWSLSAAVRQRASRPEVPAVPSSRRGLSAASAQSPRMLMRANACHLESCVKTRRYIWSGFDPD